MERAAIVYNPAARNAPPLEYLRHLASNLRLEGWNVEVLVTASAGHATELARSAARDGVSVVFACGGDGTINEVVNGITGSQAALAVLPGGMGNVFAKEIGAPRYPERALRLLFEGERRRFDLVRANGRYFLLMAGVGFDAAVVRDVPSRAKRRLGSTSYVIWGLPKVLRHKPVEVTYEADGERRQEQLAWLLLENTRSYGGVVNIARTAKVDDGLLDCYAFSGGNVAWLAATALRAALGRLDGAPGVRFRRLRRLRIETSGLPLQADGEYLGETPVEFEVEPAALDVLGPRGGRAQALFGDT